MCNRGVVGAPESAGKARGCCTGIQGCCIDFRGYRLGDCSDRPLCGGCPEGCEGWSASLWCEVSVWGKSYGLVVDARAVSEDRLWLIG